MVHSIGRQSEGVVVRDGQMWAVEVAGYTTITVQCVQHYFEGDSMSRGISNREESIEGDREKHFVYCIL